MWEMSRLGCLLRGAHAPPERKRSRARRGRILVLLAEVLLLAVALRRLGADLLVVLLEGREVLAGLPRRAPCVWIFGSCYV